MMVILRGVSDRSCSGRFWAWKFDFILVKVVFESSSSPGCTCSQRRLHRLKSFRRLVRPLNAHLQVAVAFSPDFERIRRESKKRLPEYMERKPAGTEVDFNSSLFFAKSIISRSFK
jgi:hypothetical protein